MGTPDAAMAGAIFLSKVMPSISWTKSGAAVRPMSSGLWAEIDAVAKSVERDFIAYENYTFSRTRIAHRSGGRRRSASRSSISSWRDAAHDRDARSPGVNRDATIALLDRIGLRS